MSDDRGSPVQLQLQKRIGDEVVNVEQHDAYIGCKEPQNCSDHVISVSDIDLNLPVSIEGGKHVDMVPNITSFRKVCSALEGAENVLVPRTHNSAEISNRSAPQSEPSSNCEGQVDGYVVENIAGRSAEPCIDFQVIPYSPEDTGEEMHDESAVDYASQLEGNDYEPEPYAPNPHDSVDDQTHISEYGGSILDALEETIVGEDKEEVQETVFTLWLKENREWIDLYYKHNVTQIVMDDILRNIKSPYKCWKTVVSRMCRESGVESSVCSIPICQGHMCFYKNEITHFSVCENPRPHSGDPSAAHISWLTLRGRLASIIGDKTLCQMMYEHFHSGLNDVENGASDFFHTESFRRIASKYGGVEAVKYDVFLTLSTDGFQAFRKQTHTVWPIAAIICNMHPSEWFLMRNVMLFTFIPGPTEPVDLQSFLGPLVEELKELENNGLGTEFMFYDGLIRRVRVHILWITGDLPAVKNVSGVKGHNGKVPCRYCMISGLWSVSHRHYYFPSYVRTSEGIERVFDPFRLPLRTELQSRNTILQLSYMRGQRKALLQTETGISEGSILFTLSNIVPYRSFPIDIMHLFYNICEDMISAWISSRDELYSLNKMQIRAIDLELVEYGNGIPTQLGSRPRPLSRFADCKSAEVKAFILSHSLVVLDGHLPEVILCGWREIVEAVDICWRKELTEADIGKLQVLCLKFYEHYEEHYFRGEIDRLNMCKYTVHLLLHLAECVVECGPPVNYSQHWMERYIGWTLSRMNARNLASSSLFNDAKFIEAYKLLFTDPSGNDKSQLVGGGYQVRGQRRLLYIVGTNPALDELLSSCLKSYLIRKYDGLTSGKAFEILEEVSEVGFRSKLMFWNGNQVQSANAMLIPGTLRKLPSRLRENWHVACEMTNGNRIDVYYGRILMLLDFEVSTSHMELCDNWQKSYEVALFDWASGMEMSSYGKVFKRGRAVEAFVSRTVEDISIVSRLIGVVDHLVPTQSSKLRGRRQCYFIDDRQLPERLLCNEPESPNGSNRVLRGMKGENVTNGST